MYNDLILAGSIIFDILSLNEGKEFNYLLHFITEAHDSQERISKQFLYNKLN